LMPVVPGGGFAVTAPQNPHTQWRVNEPAPGFFKTQKSKKTQPPAVLAATYSPECDLPAKFL
ncbi:hypothetical protein, partial [Enterobacter intestinihominis]